MKNLLCKSDGTERHECVTFETDHIGGCVSCHEGDCMSMERVESGNVTLLSSTEKLRVPVSTMRSVDRSRERRMLRRFLSEVDPLNQGEHKVDLLCLLVAPYMEGDEGYKAMALLVNHLHIYYQAVMMDAESEQDRLDGVADYMMGILCGNGGCGDYESFGESYLVLLYKMIIDKPLFWELKYCMNSFYYAMLVKRENRQIGNAIDSEEYLRGIRNMLSGIGSCILVGLMYHPSDYVSSYFLSEKSIFHKAIKIVSLHRDILEWDRDRANGEIYNIVRAFMVDYSEADAIKKSIRLANELLSSFIFMEMGARDLGLGVLWEACNWWIVGNYEWLTTNTCRFRQED